MMNENEQSKSERQDNKVPDKNHKTAQVKDLPPKQGDIIKGGEKVEAGSENVRR